MVRELLIGNGMRSASFLVMAALLALTGACSSTSGSPDGGGGGMGGSVGGQGGAAAAGHGGGGGGTAGAAGSGGAGGAGGETAGTTPCSPGCGAESICVGTGTVGGAIITANDAGVCPTGTHPTGIDNRCDHDLSYACMPIPAGCGGTVTCTCAGSLCTTPHTCMGPSAGVLMCVIEAP